MKLNFYMINYINNFNIKLNININNFNIQINLIFKSLFIIYYVFDTISIIDYFYISLQ